MWSKRLRQAAKNLGFTTWLGESRLVMGSIYIIAAPPGIPGDRSNHVLGVEEAEREGCCSRQLKLFFLSKIEGEAGLMTHQRGIQFCWFPILNTIWLHQTMKEKKQQAKPNSNFCLRDSCNFLFWDCLPQKLVLGGRHLFFTLLVKRQQAAGHFYPSQLFSSHTVGHAGKSWNCGRLTLVFLLSDCYPLTGLVCPLYPSLSLPV